MNLIETLTRPRSGTWTKLPKISIILAGITLLLPQKGWPEGPNAKENLLKMEYRPTVKDFLSQVDLTKPNPFKPYREAFPDPRLGHIPQEAPKLIAQLEFTFPEASWALLGRDTTFVEIILSLYTELVGEHHRTVRLNASTGTCVSPQDWKNLLISVDLLNSDGSYRKKFVVLDPTRWLSQYKTNERNEKFFYESQARTLLKGIYQGYPEEEKKSLLKKINAIALESTSLVKEDEQNLFLISPSTNVSQFFNSVLFKNGAPDRIFYTTGKFSYLSNKGFNLLGTDIAWHEKFQKLQQKADGTYFAPPGRETLQLANGESIPQLRLELREHILWFMYEAAKIILTNDFYESVVKAGTHYGLNLRKEKLSFPNTTFNELNQWLNEKKLSFRSHYPWLLSQHIRNTIRTELASIGSDAHLDIPRLKHLFEFSQTLPFKTFKWKEIKNVVFNPNTSTSAAQLLEFLDYLRQKHTINNREISWADEFKGELYNAEMVDFILTRCKTINEFAQVIDLLQLSKEKNSRISEVLSNHIIQSLQLSTIDGHFNRSFLEKYLNLLTPENRIPFIRLHTHHALQVSKNTQHYLELIRIAIHSISLIQSERTSVRVHVALKRIISDQVVAFVALGPSIQEINDLISFVKPNGSLHQEIIMETCKARKNLTKEEFDLLNKPSSKRTKEYKTLIHSVLKSFGQSNSSEDTHAKSENTL